MDLSKLPKLSQTPPSPSSETISTPTPAPGLDYSTRPAAPIAAEIWISLVLGLIFMLLGGTFARYTVAKLAHQPFHTGVNWMEGEKAGQEVEYFELQGFTALTDMSIFLFGMAMVFDGLALAATHSKPSLQLWTLRLALLVTLTATAVNLYTIARILSTGGIPILSLLAVAFGVYIAMFQWNSLRVLAAYQAQRAGRL